jgi:hypothetical protein
MGDIASAVVLLLILVGPFVSYTLMLRRPDRTRAQLILAAALGSGGPAVLVATAASALSLGGSATADLLPWVGIATGYGAAVGVLGVLARIVGAWLGRRQS